MPAVTQQDLIDSCAAAVREIVGFYRVYHSMRYVGDRLVLRVNRGLPAGFVRDLSARFRDILVSGDIVQRNALPAEHGEPQLAQLPRLVMRFDRTHFGRLRRLIDAVNEAPEP